LDTNVHYHIEERIEADGPFTEWRQVPQLPDVVEDKGDACDLATDYLILSRSIYNAELRGDGLRMSYPVQITEEFPEEDIVQVEQLTNPETGEHLQVRVVRCDAPKVLVNTETGDVRPLEGSEDDLILDILRSLLGGAGDVIVLGPGGENEPEGYSLSRDPLFLRPAA
jgi:hypothetical protein